MSATLINVLAPLIAIPVLTLGLGVSEYGVYVALVAKTALFVVFAELGLGMYLAKEISVHRDDDLKVSSLFWIFLITKLVSFFLVLGVLAIFADDFGVVEILLCALIFAHFINITPVLTGLENYKFLTKVQLFSKSLMVFLVLNVNFSLFGLEKALAIQVVMAGVTSLLLLVYFVKKKHLRKMMFDFENFKSVMRGSLPFYGAKLFVNLYQQSSTYFVSFLLSTELVAIYSIAIQLYKVGQVVVGSVARVLYTSTVKTKDFFLVKRLTVMSFFVHASLFPFVFFFGERILGMIFSFDVSVLFDLSILLYLSLFSVIVSSYWGYPVLAAIGRENYAHIGVLVASIAYFLAFLFLVFFEFMSIYTVAACVVFADFSGMLVRFYYARRFKLL